MIQQQLPPKKPLLHMYLFLLFKVTPYDMQHQDFGSSPLGLSICQGVWYDGTEPVECGAAFHLRC